METEVLIIGAGLSGAVTALRLAQAGIKVTCLEQGDWQDPERYPGNRSDFELSATGPWHANPNVRKGRSDYPVADDTSDIAPMLFNGVGGSTIVYSAHWMRFMPGDFRVKSLDGVATDWPLSYQELAPFYDRVEQDFGVSGVSGDPFYPDMPEYPMPPLPIGEWGERVARAHDELGWHWWPGSNAINSRPYDNRRPCVQRSTCRAGCNEGAKGSVDRTHWPKAIKLGTRLITNATVSSITTNAKGLADGAIYFDQHGTEQKIKAEVVVLAAHAIGTPRLLLNSTNSRFPDGLCNSSGLVGRNLMMHPLCRVVGFFDEPMNSWQGHWGQSIYSLEFADAVPNANFVRGAKWNLGPSGGPLMAAMSETENAGAWGQQLHQQVNRRLGRSAIWGITAEDLPDPEHRVVLDESIVDRFGMPAPRLYYQVDNNSRNMLEFMRKKAVESFMAAGAYDTDVQPLVTDNGWHALGTCRMGGDPGSSVVDKWHRSHDIENLYIVDGSSFVTSSCVNPSATIAALALRASEQLISSRFNQRIAT